MATTCGAPLIADRCPCIGDGFRHSKTGAERREAFFPFKTAIRHHFADKIAADDFGAGLGLANESRVVEFDRREHARHRSLHSDSADQGTRIDPFQSNDSRFAQIIVERTLRPVIARFATQLADNESGKRDSGAFDVFEIDAVIADQRVGHRDDLPAIRRIGENFLVAGHARVEHDLAKNFAAGSKCGAGENRAVGKGQFRGRRHRVFCSRAGSY